MTRSHEQNDDELRRQYEKLEQYWDSTKQSSRRRRRRSADSMHTGSHFHLLETSPTYIMSSPQLNKSPTEEGWKVRTNALAVEENLRERRAGIESGKLKGRGALFEAEDGACEMGLGETEETCSGSSVSIQGGELRSLPSYSSEDDHNDNDLHISDCCYSSSAPYLSVQNVETQKLVAEKKVVEPVDEKIVFGICRCGGDEGRCMVFIGWLAIFLMLFAFGVLSWWSYETYEDADGHALLPT